MRNRHLLPALFCLALACSASAEIPAKLNYQGRVAVEGTNFNGTGQFKFALVVPSNQNQTATASALATLSVASVSVESGGSGYTAPPLVTIAPPDDPGGVQATATATIDAGVVTGITITEAGSGYFNNPVQVTIAPPPPNIQYFTSWSNDQTSMSGGEPAGSVSLPVSNGLYSVNLGDTAAGMATLNPGVFSVGVQLRVWFSDGVNGFQQLTPDQPLSAAPYAFRAILAENVPFSSMTSDEIAEGAVAAANLAPGAVTATKLAPGAVNGAALSAGAVSSTNLATNAVTADKLADGIISPAKLSSTNAPSAGQFLRFDGTQLAWASQGLSPPFNGSINSASAALDIDNNGAGPAIEAYSNSGDAISGWVASNGKSAVYGRTTTFGAGQGVYGYGQFSGTGVFGESWGGDGVHGKSAGTGKSGVFGLATGPDSAGVHGASEQHHGVYAATGSTNRAAIWAWAPNGAEAIHGHSAGGDGVVGYTAKDSPPISLGLGTVFFTPISLYKAGVHGWTDKTNALAAKFVNTTADGVALYVDGDARFTDNAVITGNLSVLGTLTSASLSPIFGQGNNAYVANMVVCGTYNDVAEFPVGGAGATPLFQVGNGSNGAVGAANYYGGNVYADNDVSAGRLLGDSITISSIETYKPGGGVWLPSLSDARFKDVQSEFKSGLEGISKIRPVRYKYKADNPDKIPADQVYLGVIAQEVQTALPEAIITRPDGYLTVDLDQIQWAAINAIKELKAENDDLRARLEALEAKVK
jgi:hypothetical protein